MRPQYLGSDETPGHQLEQARRDGVLLAGFRLRDRLRKELGQRGKELIEVGSGEEYRLT